MGTKVETTIVREFDAEGRLVKETETRVEETTYDSYPTPWYAPGWWQTSPTTTSSYTGGNVTVGHLRFVGNDDDGNATEAVA